MTVGFTPSHKEMPLSHPLMDWDTEKSWPLASIPIFPKEKHSLGWTTRFPLPCCKSSCWLGNSESSSRGCREFLWAVPLSLLLLGLKVRKNKGEIFPSGIPHPPPSKMAATAYDPLNPTGDKQHPCGLLLICSGWQSSDVCLFYQQ